MTTGQSELRRGVSIAGLGVCLPTTTRTNDFWSAETVAAWRARSGPPRVAVPEAPGARASWEAMARFAGDPFQGVRSRPVMPDGVTTADLEIAAAREALADAKVDPRDVDFVLQHSTGNADLVPHNAFAAHAALGLGRGVFTLGVDAENDSFLTQLALARALIESGRHRVGLLLQSSQRSRLVDPNHPASVTVGDGATAAVIVGCEPGRGIVAETHLTDSSARDAYRVGAAEGPWWEGGPIRLRPGPPERMLAHMLDKVDTVFEAFTATCRAAGVTAGDVRYLACHQSAAWFMGVLRQVLGLGGAGACDTFSEHGSLAACNVPLGLALGVKGGLLRSGDLVAMVSGGAGETCSVVLARWDAA